MGRRAAPALAALAIMALALLCGGASVAAAPSIASRRLLQEQPLAEQPLTVLEPEPRVAAGAPLVRARPARLAARRALRPPAPPMRCWRVAYTHHCTSDSIDGPRIVENARQGGPAAATHCAPPLPRPPVRRPPLRRCSRLRATT